MTLSPIRSCQRFKPGLRLMWGTAPEMVDMPLRKKASRIRSCGERRDWVSGAGLHTFRYRVPLKTGGLSRCRMRTLHRRRYRPVAHTAAACTLPAPGQPVLTRHGASMYTQNALTPAHELFMLFFLGPCRLASLWCEPCACGGVCLICSRGVSEFCQPLPVLWIRTSIIPKYR
jgi:hypothetical protein